VAKKTAISLGNCLGQSQPFAHFFEIICATHYFLLDILLEISEFLPLQKNQIGAKPLILLDVKAIE
jgi:hypothetical protein